MKGIGPDADAASTDAASRMVSDRSETGTVRGAFYRCRLAAAALPLLLACKADDEGGADRPLEWSVTEAAALQAPDGAMTAVPWGVVADPGAGRVYVLDPPNHRVLIFNDDGAHLGQFGRAGEGPGEFESPSSLALRSDGTLSILDSGSGRIHRISPAGEWLGADPLTPSFFGPGHADLGDRFVMVTTPVVADDPFLLRQELSLVKDGDISVIASIAHRMVEARLPCVSTMVPKPVPPEPVWTASGDTVLVAAGLEYEVDLYEGGARVGRFSRPVPPLQVTEEMAIERIEAGQLRILMSTCGIDAATVAHGMDWSETIAPLQRIAVAPDGRVWVTRSGGSLRSARVDVLDRDGSYRGTLENIPSPITFLTPTRFVGFRLDEYLGTSLRLVDVAVN